MYWHLNPNPTMCLIDMKLLQGMRTLLGDYRDEIKHSNQRYGEINEAYKTAKTFAYGQYGLTDLAAYNRLQKQKLTTE
jgi:hypothetical protein